MVYTIHDVVPSSHKMINVALEMLVLNLSHCSLMAQSTDMM